MGADDGRFYASSALDVCRELPLEFRPSPTGPFPVAVGRPGGGAARRARHEPQPVLRRPRRSLFSGSGVR